jgi:2-phosphosulfolactate phosphatase
VSVVHRFVDLDAAAPAEAVVVIDVLRAFTTAPWLLVRGVARIVAVEAVDHALALARGGALDGALIAGERDGRPLPGFDLGNSPSALADVESAALTGRTVVQRTSAGTKGLLRTAGSGLQLAASFVTAGATAAALRRAGVREVTYVVTGASLGRDGDEDLACAELIAARVDGGDPDPAPFTARVAASDWGRMFAPDGPEWAPAADLAHAVDVDRFGFTLAGGHDAGLGAVELSATSGAGWPV